MIVASGRIIPDSDLERFWENVDWGADQECWIWSGARNGQRPWVYGSFKMRGTFKAHRLAHEIVNGSIPDGLCVCHTCDVPWCVNPDHLFLGTVGENNADRKRKGRNDDKRGVRNPKVKLSEDEVLAIRSDRRPHREIALSYDVSKFAVHCIKTGKTWSHLSAD
jgi:hypothetical protein